MSEGTLKTKIALLVTVAQNESFRTVDPLLLYIHFIDLAYHTHGGTTKVTTTGDRAKI